MHVQNEIPSFLGAGGNQIVYFVSSLFYCPYSSSSSSCFPSFLFCLSYCTAISTFWVTELIVPAHAFSTDSIIRHSGHPEKKNDGGKRGMWDERVREWKNEKVKSEEELEKVIDERGGQGQREEKGGWELRSRSKRDKLERGVRAVPWVIYLCKGKISSLECTL